jgi:hypothetical protein
VPGPLTVSLVTALSKITRSVWVGFLQLDEYADSISVHDEVNWQVAALSENNLDGALGETPFAGFELAPYAEVMGLARAPLAGTVARIRWLQYPESAVPPTAPAPGNSLSTVTSVYSTKEPLGREQQDRQTLLTKRGKASPNVRGFCRRRCPRQQLGGAGGASRSSLRRP